MKTFIIHIGKILLVTIVSAYILDAVYSYVFRNSAPRSKIQNLFQLKDASYDYAFFGSSRTENHIDCDLIKSQTGTSCVNFGIAGGTIGDMLFLMKLARFNSVKFRKTFMQVDYSYNSTGLSSNFKARLIPFINNPVVKKELYDDPHYFFYTNIPFYRYLRYDHVMGFREFAASIINRKSNTTLEVGFLPKFGEGLDLAGTFPKEFKQTNPEIKEMKALMDSQDIPLFFFTAPYCKEVENRTAIDTLSKLIPKLHNYVSVFDEYQTYFYNCGHLNATGAAAFTTILIEDFNL